MTDLATCAMCGRLAVCDRRGHCYRCARVRRTNLDPEERQMVNAVAVALAESVVAMARSAADDAAA